ncbi:hypothetical protein [uncultured Ruminococcus sp.]|uniref:hypothetical protein n=1 Tax=uncultured Ruminococcus sp. TaxID=165186 RepID=UPI0025F41740|nr:hypothetical protein [uncultured Ruminococcus sp.]
MQNHQSADELTSPVLNMDVLRSVIENPYGKQVIINGTPDDVREKPASDSKGGGAAAFLLIFMFIGGIIGAAVFSQINPPLCISCIGAIFLVIGLVTAVQSKSGPVFLVALVGLLMTALPIVYVYGKSHPDSFQLTTTMIIRLILVLMTLVGLGLMIFPHVSHSKAMSRCSQTVNAKCIYRTFHTKSSNTHSNMMNSSGGRAHSIRVYSPVWQYEVGGVIFVTSENVYTNFDVPEIGEIREIRFDPRMPSYIYRPMGGTRLIPTIIGLMFVVLSVITLFVMKNI